MDSTQAKHICGCWSNRAEPAQSFLLPSEHYPCSPAAPPQGTPTCLAAVVLTEDPLKRQINAHRCPLAGVSAYVSCIHIIYRDICEELGG